MDVSRALGRGGVHAAGTGFKPTTLWPEPLLAPFPPVARLLQKSQAPPVRLHYGCPSCPEQILMRSRVPSSAPSRTWLEDQSRWWWWWGGGCWPPSEIGLREIVQRMRFCTIDEQIESFILPFSEPVSEKKKKLRGLTGGSGWWMEARLVCETGLASGSQKR